MSTNLWSESVILQSLCESFRSQAQSWLLKDLFSQTVGPIKRLDMAYNSQGKTTGTATIEFKRPGDGAKAYADYNGRLIDQSPW